MIAVVEMRSIVRPTTSTFDAVAAGTRTVEGPDALDQDPRRCRLDGPGGFGLRQAGGHGRDHRYGSMNIDHHLEVKRRPTISAGPA